MIHQAVYDRLKNNAGVSSIVAARVYPQKAVQGVVLPCVVYSRIGTSDRGLHHGGTTETARSRFQIDCWAKSPTKALELAEAVVACLHGWRGTQSGEAIFSTEVINTQDDFDLATVS